MADTLPPPPVPADADLTHFDNMPLEVRRLRDSGIAGTADAEAFRCGLLSWAVAWHQLPAGSLPKDDPDLCRLVGLGRDLKTWKRIKASAMRGWREFGDGRLYHPVLTEKVIEGWNSTRLNRWNKECDRLRKENKAREKRKEDLLPYPEKPALIPYWWPTDERKISAGSSSRPPTENALNGMEWNGMESLSEAAASVPRARPAADPPTEAAATDDQESPVEQPQIADATAKPGDQPADDLAMPGPLAQRQLEDRAYREWSDVAKELGWPDAGFLNSALRPLMAQRLAEAGGIEGWRVALSKAREALYLRNDDDTPKWWVNLKWFLDPGNFTGLMEGRYAERHHHRRTDERSTAAAIAGLREELDS